MAKIVIILYFFAIFVPLLYEKPILIKKLRPTHIRE